MNAVSGSRDRAPLRLAGLVLLLVAVAVASTGSVPAGAGGTRRFSTSMIDVLASLYLILMLVGVGLWAYLFLFRRDVVVEAIARRRTRSPFASAAALALGFGLLALFLRWLSVDAALRRRLATGIHPPPAGPAGAGLGRRGDHAHRFATGPVLVVLALVAFAAGAYYLSHRARRRPLERVPAVPPPTLSEVLEETLDDLRAEQDGRRAVIAAYARMERALAASGLPRSAAEAPAEYLSRIFAELEVSRRATARLTALYTWAKFSGHDVAPEMKQEAIEALEAVRAELQAAASLAEHERLQAVAASGRAG